MITFSVIMTFPVFANNLKTIIMRKIYFSLLVAGVAFTGMAQSKLDLRSRAALRQHKVEYNLRTKSFEPVETAKKSVTAMIKLAPGATASQLEAEGVKVMRTRGDIAFVVMPVEDVERVSALSCIKTMSLSRKAFPKMDNARTAMGVDKIHSGEGLEQAYTGKGVIAGIVDAGLDPNHANFRNPDGTSRIGLLTNIYSTSYNSDGYNADIYTADQIPGFTTDDETQFHGTHTLGIMAGSYKDTLTVAKGTSMLSAKVETDENPFYGVAYDADIAASCCELSDYFIALGIENILDYAYQEQKPAVINISLGSNINAHDGTETMSQYLDLAGKEAIICVAAGNEGDLPIALNQTFTSEDSVLQTFVTPLYGDVATANGIYYNLRYDQVYIYSNDSTEFKVKMVVYNKDRGTIVMQHTIDSNTNGTAAYYASGDQAQSGDLTNTNFSKAFSGYVGLGSMIDENNGRYYALLDYFIMDNQATNANGNYILGFIVEGKVGQRIDCFCSGLYSYMDGYAQDGWDNGSTNGSISDMACAHNILVVGAYNTRNAWVSLDGKPYANAGNYPLNHVTSFSSYGTLIDGRNLPHVLAPGNTVISSSSSYYIDYYGGLDDSAFQAKLVEDSRTNYWHQQAGTSMATPAVSGAIALWLEADPTLTIDEVKEIAMSTAVKDSYISGFEGDPVQCGEGKFNAYEGLKEVLRRAAGIGCITADENNRLLISVSGRNQYNLFIGGANEMNAVFYNLSGQPVLTAQSEGDELNVDASSLASGIYVLSVNGYHNKRIFVK